MQPFSVIFVKSRTNLILAKFFIDNKASPIHLTPRSYIFEWEIFKSMSLTALNFYIDLSPLLSPFSVI